jgi:hypothetical protein
VGFYLIIWKIGFKMQKIKFGYTPLGAKVRLPNNSVVKKTHDMGWYLGVCNAEDKNGNRYHIDNDMLVEVCSEDSSEIFDFCWGDQVD